MGLFSSKKKITVSSAAMHLADVESMSNPVSDTIIEAILTSGVPVASMQNITGNLLTTHTQGLFLKMERAYDYARDHYKLGLPSGATLAMPLLTRNEIKPYILAETGYPYDIVITDYEYAPYTPKLAIAAFLRNVRGFDPIEQEITVWPEGTVFTSYWGEDTSKYQRRVVIDTVTVKEDEVTALITYRKYIYRPVSSKINIFYQWVDDGTITEETAIPGAVTGMTWEGDCLFALYRKYDQQGVLQNEYVSWVYHLDTYLYPELHPDVEQEPSTYMPVIPLRYNNQDLTRPSETELYLTSKELLQKVDLKLEALGDQLNKNPDISAIDHAYVMFGVNVQTEHIPSLFYLNCYFHQVMANQRADETEFLAVLANPDYNDEPFTTIDTNSLARLFKGETDSLKEYGLSLDVRYDYIKSQVTDEVIGRVGYATKEIKPYDVTIRFIGPFTTATTIISSRRKLVLRAQINAAQVRTVEVYNLGTINSIYKGKSENVFLQDVQNNKDENGLIIPIQYQFSRTVFTNMQDMNSFYADTMLLIINSYEVTKIKWYQKGFFKILVMVVMIVIAVWAGQVYLAKVGAAYAAGGVVAALTLIGKGVLLSLAISYAVRFVVKNFGEQLGIFGAMLAMAAAVIASKGFGLLGTASEFMMTTCNYMLQISSALISSANEFLLEAGAKIQENYAAFTEKLAGLWEELEETLDLLEWKADIDPLIFTKPERFLILPNETPTVFFKRCLELPDNSLYAVHDEIPNFFDMRLRHNLFPSFSQNSLFA